MEASQSGNAMLKKKKKIQIASLDTIYMFKGL